MRQRASLRLWGRVTSPLGPGDEPSNFPTTAFLGEAQAAALGPELARLGVSGSAVYDALVGAAARQHRQSLVTGDARARPVYESLGVEIQGVE